MTASRALLEALRRRGIELQREGERLRWRAPRGVLRPTDLAALRQAKAELLEALAAEAGFRESSDEAPDLGPEAGPILDVRERVGAVLVRPRAFGEVWLVLADRQLEELAAEETRRPVPRPILFAEDVGRLRGKPDGATRAALEVARAFPGARVLQ